MANQIVVSSGAKVRNLEGVLTGTSGVVSSVPLGAANGVATLDSGGKVPVSQLPSSVVTYLGTWNAATNTPTLVNGTGDAGDLYLCNVAGTVNFGAGPIVFVIGDWVLYGSGTWQKSNGQNGTVTSVAASITGNSLGITGSPITTAGTLAFAFAGTNLQYVNGAGNLTTFPILTGYVTSVTGTAPVVSSGGTTPAISMAAATTSVNGYLTSTDWTTFNNKQSTITNPITGTGATGQVAYWSGTSTQAGNNNFFWDNTNGRLGIGIATPSAPLDIHATGTNAQFNGTGTNNAYLVFQNSGASKWKIGNTYTGGANTFDLYNNGLTTNAISISSTTNDITITGNLNTGVKVITTTALVSQTALIVKNEGSITGTNGYSSFSGNAANNGFTFAPNNSSYHRFITPTTGNYDYTLPTASGTIALTSNLSSYLPLAGGIMTGSILLNNNLTISGQLFGTSSYASMIAMSPSDKVLIDNSGRGVNFGGTIGNGTYTYTLPSATGTLALTSQLTSGTVTSVAALTLGTTGTDVSSSVANSTTTPVITLNVPTASATNRGALSSTDWTTFNNKQNALTNPVTGTGASGRVALWSGTTTQTSSVGLTFDSTNGVLTSGTYYSYNNVGAAYNLSSNGDNVGKIQNVTSLSWALAYGGSSSIYPLGTAVLTWDTTNKVTFSGTLSNGTYTYTLPSATGTLALTSSLSSYLPLTGGTLTGQLYINPTNTATVGLDVASNTTRFRSDNLEGFKRQLEITMGSGTLVQMVAKGFGGTYGTDLAFYTSSASGVNGSPAMYITGGNQIGLGNGNPAYTLDVSGTGRFTGALNLTGTASDTNQASGAPFMYLQGGGSSFTTIQQAVGKLSFWQFNGSIFVNTFNITNAGNVGIGTSNPSSYSNYRYLTIMGSSISNGGVVDLRTSDSSVNMQVYVDNITGGNINVTTAHPLVFDTSGSERMRITSGGNVGIGTTAASAGRLVVTSANNTSAIYAAIFSDSSGADLLLVRGDGAIFTGTRTNSPYNLSTSGRSAVIESSGALGYLVSTRESKANIESIKSINFINQLNPVSFNYRKKDNEMNYTDEVYDNTTYGFIADEVEKVNKDLVFYNADGALAGVEYNSMIAILTKVAQEQQIQIQNLQEQINILAK